MVANPRQSCYTVSRMEQEDKWHMKVEGKYLPQGWLVRIGVITAAALAGNLLVGAIPWPESSLAAYEAAMDPAAALGVRFLVTTLVLAPLVEEAVFRLVLYGWLKRFMGFWPSAIVSSLAFGAYHGNWIQGTYAFLTGMILAWGYETSDRRRYLMVVLMHGAANLAALAVFGM